MLRSPACFGGIRYFQFLSNNEHSSSVSRGPETMFLSRVLLSAALLTFQRDSYGSACLWNCTDMPVFTPSRLVVKFGDPTSAICNPCQRDCIGRHFGLEKKVGEVTMNTTTIFWKVNKTTQWDASPDCYYNNANNVQCCASLNVTVYQPPKSVSVSLLNHSGPLTEGQTYTLQCTVCDVAPVKDLTVTFYREQTELERSSTKNGTDAKTPVNATFTYIVKARKEDRGSRFSCKAKLELESDERLIVVEKESITTPLDVHYKPLPPVPTPSVLITVKAGDLLQLNCSSEGNPEPSYLWTLPPGDRTSHRGSVLSIQPATTKHSGCYVCSVSNPLGSVSVQYEVDVQVSYIYYIIAAVLGGLLLLGLVITGVAIYIRNKRQKGKYNLMELVSGCCTCFKSGGRGQVPQDAFPL
ncbi:cell adhesion molecule 4-like [Aulostomus maculatus]